MQDSFTSALSNEMEKLLFQKIEAAKSKILFLGCNSGQEFMKKVYVQFSKLLSYSKEFDISIVCNENNISRSFSDGETCSRLDFSVSGYDAYIFQSTNNFTVDYSVNENIMELLQSIRVLKVSRVNRITVIFPYLPYSRQDKPTYMAREAVNLKLLIDLLYTAGMDRLVTYHPHSMNLYGLCEPNVNLSILSGIDLMCFEIKERLYDKNETILVATDAGGAKFVKSISDRIGINYVIANKNRSSDGKSSFLGMSANCDTVKKIIIIDDEISTGNTVLDILDFINTSYPAIQVDFFVSHLKISESVMEKFNSYHKAKKFNKIITTDSIVHPSSICNSDFIEFVSISSFFAIAIFRLHFNVSISEIFKEGLRL